MPLFPPQIRKDTETVLNYSGNVRLIKKRNRVELWRGNKIIVCEGALDRYREFASLIRGDVLEVGTGIGEFVQFALLQPNLTKIWTVDIDGDFQNIYTQRFGVNSKVVLVNDDISNYITGVSKRFDCIFLDIEYFDSEAMYNKCIQFALWASTHLKVGGVLIVPAVFGFTEDFARDASTGFNSVDIVKNSITGHKGQNSHILFNK